MAGSSKLVAIVLPLLFAAGAALTQADVANLRHDPLAQNGTPPPMRPQMDTDIREVRNYPEQPPVIPHSIERYQVTGNFNECMDCHARHRTGMSQAPMVSITHYMDREGQFLAQISPRRYFCTQCHVPQHPDEPMVENTFIDIDTLLSVIARDGAAPAE